jgi:catechol 2,3-dioxygenase-like lactoylglutathione lyase family enzyme
MMDQRVSIVTLGVRDLARSRRFYEEMGWRGQEVEETVFFQAGGQAVVLWGREKLAADSGVPDDAACSFAGIALAHNVRSPEEVDLLVARAASAGATVTRTPSETFYGGYAGCFRDPDGHVWEIAFNQGFPLDDHGNLTVPPFGDPG